jgi:hypothetical protein
LGSFRNELVRPPGGIGHAAAKKRKLMLEICHSAFAHLKNGLLARKGPVAALNVLKHKNQLTRVGEPPAASGLGSDIPQSSPPRLPETQ